MGLSLETLAHTPLITSFPAEKSPILQAPPLIDESRLQAQLNMLPLKERSKIEQLYRGANEAGYIGPAVEVALSYQRDGKDPSVNLALGLFKDPKSKIIIPGLEMAVFARIMRENPLPSLDQLYVKGETIYIPPSHLWCSKRATIFFDDQCAQLTVVDRKKETVIKPVTPDNIHRLPQMLQNGLLSAGFRTDGRRGIRPDALQGFPSGGDLVLGVNLPLEQNG
jgi:hypothetical protein